MLRVFRAFSAPADHLTRETALLELVEAATRHLAERGPSAPLPRREHRAVGLVRAYLREHPGESTSLGDLAALTGLNKFYLLDVFRRDVGVSPHVFLAFVRVQEAKRLLAAGVPLAEIAARAGFADQSHLNRVFKRHTMGVPPGRYRHDSNLGTPTASKTKATRGA